MRRLSPVSRDDGATRSGLSRRLVALTVLFNAALVVWLLWNTAGHAALTVVDNVAQFLGPLLLVPPCLAGAIRQRRAARAVGGAAVPVRWRASALIGAAVFVYSVGEIIYAYYEVILRYPTAPFPSWADAAFLAYYPVILLGILFLPTNGLSGVSRVRVALDGLMIMAAVAIVSWYFVLGPTILQGSDSLLTRIVADAYPLGDLTLVFCLIVLLAHTGDTHLRPVLGPLALGLSLNVVTDSIYDVQQLHATYHTGTLLDVGWPVAYMLIAVAGHAATRLAPRESSSPLQQPADTWGWQAILPYALIPPVAVLAAYTWFDHGPVDDALEPGVLAGLGVLIGLVLARQFVTLLDNRRLLLQLRTSEERFRALFEHATDLVSVVGVDGAIQYASPSHHRILGYTPEEVRQLALTELVHLDDRAGLQHGFVRMLPGAAETRHGEVRLRHANGSWRILDMVSVDRRDDPAVRGIIITSHDVTARWRAEAALRASEARKGAILEAAVDAIVAIDCEGRITEFNPAAEQAFGYSRAEALGCHLDEVIVPPSERGRHTRGLASYLATGHARILGKRIELTALRRDGAEFPIELTVVRVPEAEPAAFVGYIRDISERKAADEALRHQALHDALTDLPNRTLLRDRLAQAILSGRDTSRPLALLLLDLDRFKEVNDTYGHHQGDELLQEVAHRLRGVVRSGDTAARLGGDEFAILLPGEGDDGACAAARKIAAALAPPVAVEGHAVHVGCSIGVALYPAHGADGETLLRRADVAMYVAKRSGESHAVYAPEQDAYTPERLALVSTLHQAIADGALMLHYQPQMDLTSGAVRGVEVLLRWTHPQRGPIGPDVFIPLAEEMGLIGRLTRWVLEEALRQCRRWLDAGTGMDVAVNLSAANLREPGLPETIAALLHAHGVPPQRLRLEVTEGTLMAEPDRAREILTRVAALGVGLSIDDYGTGYSSLAYLKRLPVDELKIDRSFVYHMAGDGTDTAIVASTIGLGHSLGLRVVAEGVEDEQTHNLLASMGCDVVQGYHLSRPLAADELERRFLSALSDVA